MLHRQCGRHLPLGHVLGKALSQTEPLHRQALMGQENGVRSPSLDQTFEDPIAVVQIFKSSIKVPVSKKLSAKAKDGNAESPEDFL